MKTIEKTLKAIVVLLLITGLASGCAARKCGCPNKQGMVGYK